MRARWSVAASSVAFGLCLLAASPVRAAELALKKVMLSSAGIGYFEYAAEVDGPATLGLDVKLDQVDDVLASLVVFDDAGGVGGLELPGRDETEAAFADVPFNRDALASPLALLNSLQGVEITVAGPRPMTGRIVQAETVNEPVAAPQGSAPQAVARTRVTLIGPGGMHQFVLEDAEQVQVTDPDLRGRIGHALESLRRDARADRRHLSIRAPGSGHRIVRVGFVAVAPLWKASYRLVLPDAPAPGSAPIGRVQGWAVLENATGADWNGVDIALQYGNPVTFHQALYRSYFVQRPEVPVEILGRLLPDVDTGSRAEPASAGGGVPVPPPPPAPAAMAQNRALSRPMTAAMPAPSPPAEAAAIAEGTEETVFSLAAPLTLPAGHTASLPILDQKLPAERVGLLLAGRPHPLASVKLTNATASSLPAGVLTLYDPSAAASFAGDARLGGLPAGESRLLSFAEDLRSSAEWRTGDATTLAAVTAAAGVLHLDQRDRRTTTITLTAPAKEGRHLLVEIAKTPGYALVRDNLAEGGPTVSVEETATAWRLGVTLAAGEVRRLTVHTDRLRRQQVALIDDDAAVVRLIGDQALSAPARAALQRLADLRRTQAEAETARDRLKADLEAADNDEERVRSNLAAVAAGDALHARLIRQLDADETRIAALNQAIGQADQAVERARAAFRDAAGRFTL